MRYKAKSIEPALNVLAFHGKSFRFAGRFLNKKQLEDCARLYRFCRFVDDLVDKESDILLAQKKLDRIKQNLELITAKFLLSKTLLSLPNIIRCKIAWYQS